MRGMYGEDIVWVVKWEGNGECGLEPRWLWVKLTIAKKTLGRGNAEH